jgi:SAM-dependent methyltransferase
LEVRVLSPASVSIARYDGQAEWYESFATGDLFAQAREAAVRLLGPGPGTCLDLGCGTGHAIPLLAEAGWAVTGVDLSGDQLAVAEREEGQRAERLMIADAHELPFENGTFDAVVSILTHTDFDDLRRALAEARRVLRAGGPFVYLGVHPCFGSPAVERRAGEPALLHPEYRVAGWQTESRNFSETGIRSRVGINHLPLATFLNAFLAAGLVLEAFEEPGDLDPPLFFAVRATG